MRGSGERHAPVFHRPSLRQIEKAEAGHEAAAEHGEQRHHVENEEYQADEGRRRIAPNPELDDLRFELAGDGGELAARDEFALERNKNR